MKHLMILFFFALISGCSSLTSPARKHQLDSSKTYWIDYDATRRGTIVSGSDVNWKACAEPSPDAAISVIAKLKGSLEVAGNDKASGDGELTQSIVNLTEKTQMIHFLRESLFRLCELSINAGLDSNEAKELYVNVIGTASALVEKEKAEVELKRQRLESANQAKYVYEFLNEKEVNSEIIQELLKSMP